MPLNDWLIDWLSISNNCNNKISPDKLEGWLIIQLTPSLNLIDLTLNKMLLFGRVCLTNHPLAYTFRVKSPSLRYVTNKNEECFILVAHLRKNNIYWRKSFSGHPLRNYLLDRSPKKNYKTDCNPFTFTTNHLPKMPPATELKFVV